MLRSTKIARRIVRLAVLCVAAMSGFPLPAEAHPHVWIKVRTQLVVEGGALVGLHHIWVLDEGWLMSQLEEHDKDKDGKLSPAELAPLVEESAGTLATFKSFTSIRQGNSRIRPGAPRDMAIDYYGDRLGMSFAVPLDKPIPLAGATLLLEVYDATYFSGYAFAPEEPVSFAGEQPPGCTIDANAAASPQQVSAYKMMARQLGPEFVAKGVTLGSVAISCARAGASGEAVGFVGAGR